MKKYVIRRTLTSILSIMCVVTIVFGLIFSLLPRDKIFKEDETFKKLAGKPDQRTEYQMATWKKLGYIEMEKLTDFCAVKYGNANDQYLACLENDSPEAKEFVEKFESKKWNITYLPQSGMPIASRDVPLIKRLGAWYSNLVQIDNPWKVQDANNPDLERKLYFGQTPNGGPAILCSGCEQKYFIYTDLSFPFIHLNFIDFNLGRSYPTFQGNAVLDVMSQTQGKEDQRPVTFPTGVTQNSALDLKTCKYKPIIDKLDKNKFTDNYADCSVIRKDPSMFGTSFIMGILALILTYAVALPCGIRMANRKDKIEDKIGMAYIIFIIAVPSLAYIYIFRYLGMTIFKLPATFPILGSGNPLSYVLPIISLALASIAGTMMWIRRYMIDQTSADYVKFAKAKGLNRSEIFYKHILRNAIIPIAHGIPSAIVFTLAGAIVTETVYAVPGMGKMLPDALNQNNNNMIIALVFIFTSLSIFSVFAGDVLITYIDPRINLVDKEGRN